MAPTPQTDQLMASEKLDPQEEDDQIDDYTNFNQLYPKDDCYEKSREKKESKEEDDCMVGVENWAQFWPN